MHCNDQSILKLQLNEHCIKIGIKEVLEMKSNNKLELCPVGKPENREIRVQDGPVMGGMSRAGVLHMHVLRALPETFISSGSGYRSHLRLSIQAKAIMGATYLVAILAIATCNGE